jgi:16S rRNA (adenine1518-N6/adenine1519-N6)-dimethyltransferase
LQVGGPPALQAAALLRRHGLRADQRLGQNFLEDPRALEEIVAAAQISPADAVLEIGPGLGSLTRHLLEVAREVVAVELDAKFMPVLKSVLKGSANVRLVQGDILELSPEGLGLPDGYVVAANIPYNITSAIFRHLLGAGRRPRRMVLTVQKEVALRICARPPEMSRLALSVQVYGAPEIQASIPAGAFYPKPKVDSAVVRVEVFPEPAITAPLLPEFFKLIQAGFGQKRKMLRNSLAAGLGWQHAQTEALLVAAGIDPQRRAETLSLGEWAGLTRLSVARPG